jgi:cellulose synthase/poly-beta-1,6-N-acetylglucosamine synthase-like glycosyltransferase
MQTDSAAQTVGTACVVTCHNYGRFLRKCLASILAQSLPFEHIMVVDDASTDDTPRIVAEHGGREVRYLRGEWRHFTTARRAGLATLPRTRFLLFVRTTGSPPISTNGCAGESPYTSRDGVEHDLPRE